MNKLNSMTPVSALLALSLVAAPQITAAATNSSPAINTTSKVADGKCGEAKCGSNIAKQARKAAEAKCGSNKKAAEAKCGADKKAADGKCGADKK